MITSKCKWCSKKILRGGLKKGVFCSLQCKGKWQETQKPATREWLFQKYVVEQIGTYKIGKMVHRNAKRVYEWLVNLKIPVRKHNKWIVSARKRHVQKKWLEHQYTNLKRSGPEIAKECGVTVQNIFYFLRKFKVKRRSTSECRKVKKWGSPGRANGMFGRRGPKSSRWKGGCSGERQVFYSSFAWKSVAKLVKNRDNNKCKKCGRKKKLHIHHIISFAVKKYRLKPSNLALLCMRCHGFVHSRKNVKKLFIRNVRSVG